MKLKTKLCSSLFVILLGLMGSGSKKSGPSTAKVNMVIIHTDAVNSVNGIGTAPSNNNFWHAPFSGNAGN